MYFEFKFDDIKEEVLKINIYVNIQIHIQYECVSKSI